MPLGLEHSGTYVCIATNAYGSTRKAITLQGETTIFHLRLHPWILAVPVVQATEPTITIDIEPSTIISIGHQVRLDCQLPQSSLIVWSSRNHGGRLSNPLTIRLTTNDTNTRLFCHAKNINGQWFRKPILIQRYSRNQLALSVSNTTSQQSMQSQNQRKRMWLMWQVNRLICSNVIL